MKTSPVMHTERKIFETAVIGQRGWQRGVNTYLIGILGIEMRRNGKEEIVCFFND